MILDLPHIDYNQSYIFEGADRGYLSPGPLPHFPRGRPRTGGTFLPSLSLFPLLPPSPFPPVSLYPVHPLQNHHVRYCLAYWLAWIVKLCYQWGCLSDSSIWEYRLSYFTVLQMGVLVKFVRIGILLALFASATLNEGNFPQICP